MNAKELQNRLKKFAYRVVKMTEILPKTKTAETIRAQLIRSAFSAATNYRASCNALSDKAFVTKLSIAFDESDVRVYFG